MRLARSLLLALPLLAACADTEITTTNPSAPSVSEPAHAVAAPDRAPEPAERTAASEACDASNAYVASGNVPSTWKKTGKVTFTIKGNAVTAEQALDAAGKTVAEDRENAPLARDTLEKFPAKWICLVGAVAVVNAAETSSDADLSKPSGGKVVFDVWSAGAEAEATDLALLCREPAASASDPNPIARLVGMHAVAQWMTTPRYRALARSIDVAIAESPSPDARRAAALAAADRIDAQTRGRGLDPCGYATVLRALAAAK